MFFFYQHSKNIKRGKGTNIQEYSGSTHYFFLQHENFLKIIFEKDCKLPFLVFLNQISPSSHRSCWVLMEGLKLIQQLNWISKFIKPASPLISNFWEKSSVLDQKAKYYNLIISNLFLEILLDLEFSL